MFGKSFSRVCFAAEFLIPMKIFIDQKVVTADKVMLDSLTPGVLQARGIFETMRSDEGCIFLFEDHMVRLQRGLRLLNLRSPCSQQKIKATIERLLRLNKLQHARVRLLIWKEHKKTRIAIMCLAASRISFKKHSQGIEAVISDKRIKRSKTSHIKTLNYSFYRQALLSAKRQGKDEVLFLNQHGHLAEGAISNVFYIRNNTVYTPAISTGCLNGITRHYVLQSAKSFGLKCRIVKAAKDALLKADEAFVTNSLLGIMPLVKVGNVKIGSGKAGVLTQAIFKTYQIHIKKVSKK